MLNRDNEVIYIGKTNNIVRRMKEHESKKEWFAEVDSIFYGICADELEQRIYETYYVVRDSPKYNKQNRKFVNNVVNHSMLKSLNWKELNKEEDLNDEKVDAKILFLLGNFSLVEEIVDKVIEMTKDITDIRDIDIYDIYLLQSLVKTYDERKKSYVFEKGN